MKWKIWKYLRNFPQNCTEISFHNTEQILFWYRPVTITMVCVFYQFNQFRFKIQSIWNWRPLVSKRPRFASSDFVQATTKFESKLNARGQIRCWTESEKRLIEWICGSLFMFLSLRWWFVWGGKSSLAWVLFCEWFLLCTWGVLVYISFWSNLRYFWDVLKKIWLCFKDLEGYSSTFLIKRALERCK